MVMIVDDLVPEEEPGNFVHLMLFAGCCTILPSPEVTGSTPNREYLPFCSF